MAKQSITKTTPIENKDGKLDAFDPSYSKTMTFPKKMYCGQYGCDSGIIWMMSEFSVPCEECKKMRMKQKERPSSYV